MKKWKHALLAGIAACTVMTATASAASFESTATAMKSMGLFAGTSTGYELNRAPTRAEAATMLVRLLGKTAEAETLWASSKDTFAFRDMDAFDWAQPYVHWLARSGLAAGTSADCFSPADPCTAQMYAAFLMRALGYSEADGDFSFENVLAFARSHGVINDVNCDTKTFLRDHVVAASYTALASAPKSGEADLLTKLVNSGAVSASAASMEQQKFSAYRGYVQTMQPAAEGAALENVTSISVSGGLSLDVAAVSESRLSGNRLSTQSSLTITVPGDDPFVQERTGYYADGRWYTNADGVKTWKPAALDELLQQLALPEAAPLVLLDEIRIGSAEYYLTYSAAGRAYYQEYFKLLAHTLGGTPAMDQLSISGLNAEIRVADGVLSSLSTSVTASGKLSGGTAGTEITMRAQQNSKVSAVGSEVTVNTPDDLSSYTPST